MPCRKHVWMVATSKWPFIYFFFLDYFHSGIDVFKSFILICLCIFRLDRHTQATTFIHQIFGGYLRSRGTHILSPPFFEYLFKVHWELFKVHWEHSILFFYFYRMLNLLLFLKISVKCMNCKGVSDTFDPYLDITLEIKVNFWFLFAALFFANS